MNVLFNNRVFFNVKIEEASCFYFCEHFYKAFKEKKPIKNASILQYHPAEELIGYCCECQKKIQKLCSQFEALSNNYFIEAKKTLIQYYPIVKWKGVFVIDIKCIEPPIIILFKIMPVSSLFLCNISSPTNTFFQTLKFGK